MDDAELSREELLARIAELRQEVDRLRAELRRARRETREVPPHYL
ncbi:MAG: hypothetical protein ACHQFZ_11355 [Acidimicrobiales bacterium]